MGGAIRVIIIKNGITTKQTRWTNNLPEFVKHDKFIERNEEWWNDYVTKESEYSSPEDNFSPDGYGMDIFDFDKKIIYSNQNYCNYQQIESSNILIYQSDKIDLSTIDTDYYYPIVAKRMWDKKMIEPQVLDLSNHKILTTKPKTFEAALRIARSMFDMMKVKRRYLQFIIKWKELGWQLNKYEDWPMYFEVVKQNYSLTSEEITDWGKWIKEYAE